MSNTRILIVEDDEDVRLGYQVLLQAHHFDTFCAADALSAVSEAHRQQPDLIILDLSLRGGDGFAVLEEYRASEDLAMVPVIVVSAYDVHGNKERALEAGARAFFQKPWDDDELLATVGKLLGQSEVPSPAKLE